MGKKISSTNMDPANFLAACFSSGELPVGSTGASWKDPNWHDINWEELIRLAAWERVLPALHARLHEVGVWSQVPSEVANFLSAVEELNFERNQTILIELAAVASLLNKAGIEPVLLKGAAYHLTRVYTTLAGRYLGDIDLLIPELQLPAAVEALLENGFEADQSDRFCSFRHHHPALHRRGSIHFELHHSLGVGICKSLLPASAVLAQSVPHDLQGTRVRIPCPDHLIAHLVMHSQIQHPYNERIWPPLCAMYDLVLLRRRFDSEIDWSSIERYFRRAGQYGVLVLHLLQVQNLLGAEPPLPIRLTFTTHLRWFHRKLLRARPDLRFLDPFYMYSTVLGRRLRLLRSALAVPGGWRHIARELFAPAIYQRFITDIIEGYGR